jgi:3-oxoacyl-[acyl-carrier protein] reductase
MRKHQDKVFIVRAAAEVGRAYVNRLAAEGARVAIAEIDAQAGSATAEDARNLGIDAVLSRPTFRTRCYRENGGRRLDRWGQIDGLVANARLANSVGGALYDEITVEQWDRIMQVNVRDTWLTCRAVAPHMQKRKKEASSPSVPTRRRQEVLASLRHVEGCSGSVHTRHGS